jgi:hypothetical protein
MRTVDNHLLIIARSMTERKAAVDKQIRREKRAAFYKATVGLAKRATFAVGRGIAAVAKAPVNAVRSRFAKPDDEPKSKKKATKRTAQSKSKTKTKRSRKSAVAPAAAPAK